MKASGSDAQRRRDPAALRPRGRARIVLERPPSSGWLTTDEHELALRRWRGQAEIEEVVPLEPAFGHFGRFRATSAGGGYEVEIRDLGGAANSCGCIDHRVNGLGTCKHVEAVLAALRGTGARAFRQAAAAGSPRIELFLDRRGTPRPAILWPAQQSPGAAAARAWLAPFLGPDGRAPDGTRRLGRLLAAWPDAAPRLGRWMRVSRHLAPWLERQARERGREAAKARFRDDLAAGRASLDLLREPLLPYQVEGVLHLAFGERALLADEMGLGKTVQAIAACELLARTREVRRVLVVCPASLKAEWEEQIGRFVDRPTRVVFGPRAGRLAAYREPAFFTIVNYEQVVTDAAELNRLLAPDLVVLDEAQRIKNWQTKTARRVKSLQAPYAFVLTGTPLENRIDELYSIVQYLDPEILGPLFRFNREFYQLDARGRPVNYQNLAELRQRLQPLMLRRRKSDVEAELPGRTLKTYFVPMAEEQWRRYEDYHRPALQLLAKAQRRPLTKDEQELLQKLLACMRMVCDTPAILDPSCRVSPKLEELERVLQDLLEEPGRKVIVFSEWERMLQLVRELAAEMGIGAAWHTGSVPQQHRRAEIVRFKQDPACRLFLSTDSGSVGLNLQVASAVVNVDLPWNPARLEQRIARAWRKNQLRSVSVINLVTQDSVESGIMQLLGRKQALADGVLDGRGDLAALRMPSGPTAFIERMQAVMAAGETARPRLLSPGEALAEALKQRHGERALLVEERQGADGRPQLLAVLDLDSAALAAEQARLAEPGQPAIELLDRSAWLALRRLAAGGLLQLAGREPRLLHRAPGFAESELAAPATPARQSVLLAEAGRSWRMATVLAGGGFPEEAPPLLAKALAQAAAARLAESGEPAAAGGAASESEIRRLVDGDRLPGEALALLERLRPGGSPPSDAEIEHICRRRRRGCWPQSARRSLPRRETSAAGELQGRPVQPVAGAEQQRQVGGAVAAGEAAEDRDPGRRQRQQPLLQALADILADPRHANQLAEHQPGDAVEQPGLLQLGQHAVHAVVRLVPVLDEEDPAAGHRRVRRAGQRRQQREIAADQRRGGGASADHRDARRGAGQRGLVGRPVAPQHGEEGGAAVGVGILHQRARGRPVHRVGPELRQQRHQQRGDVGEADQRLRVGGDGRAIEESEEAGAAIAALADQQPAHRRVGEGLVQRRRPGVVVGTQPAAACRRRRRILDRQPGLAQQRHRRSGQHRLQRIGGLDQPDPGARPQRRQHGDA
jgi:hypothetical protein